MACRLAGHYLNQCWNIVDSNPRNKLQWNPKGNPYIFIQENPFENVVWKKAAILSRPQCVKLQSYPPVDDKMTAKLGRWGIWWAKTTVVRRWIDGGGGGQNKYWEEVELVGWWGVLTLSSRTKWLPFRRWVSNTFSWMKSFVFWFKFHWDMLAKVQLTIRQHWFR